LFTPERCQSRAIELLVEGCSVNSCRKLLTGPCFANRDKKLGLGDPLHIDRWGHRVGSGWEQSSFEISKDGEKIEFVRSYSRHLCWRELPVRDSRMLTVVINRVHHKRNTQQMVVRLLSTVKLKERADGLVDELAVFNPYSPDASTPMGSTCRKS
jgi:hypothetical protein